VTAQEHRGLSSWSGRTVPPGAFTAELGSGFPYFVSGRLTAGGFSSRYLALDFGVQFRTFFQTSEIGAHVKLQLLRAGQFGIAVFTEIGGGGGPGQKNSFYGDLGVIASLHLRNIVTFSAAAYGDFYTDRLCPGKAGSTDEAAACSQSPATLDIDHDPRERFNGARFMLRASLEIAITRLLNVFFVFEGPPFQPGREAFMERWNSFMPQGDPETYFTLGASFKF
jgi:hypothetical protein